MKDYKSYIIIPGCSDLNRGDQALVWESVRLFKEDGRDADFLLMSEKNEPVKQSIEHGLGIISPVLEHPSRKFKNKNNLQYTKWLKVKWGLVSLCDLVRSLLFLTRYTRWMAKLFLDKDVLNSYHAFEKADSIIVKGGGFIHAYGGLTASYYIFFSLFHIFLAQSLGKNVYIMPNSMGPFEGPMVKWMVKRAFLKCKMVLTRESVSEKMIYEQIGFKSTTIPDLAFFLENGNVDKQLFFQKYNLPIDRKLVALTMRPHRFPKSATPDEDYVRFKKSIAGFTKWLYNNGYMPILVEHVLAVNYNESDWECIKEVRDYLIEGEYVVVSNREFTCHQLKTIYSFFDYIVGTRFHSMIFSMSNNIPGIAITYTGNKGQGIMHDMNLDDFVVSIDDVTEDILIDKFNFLIKNESSVKRRISKYLEHVSDSRKTILELLK